MDIHFGKTNNQITNGKVVIDDVSNSVQKSLNFEGDINKTNSTLDLYPRNGSHGAGGSGTFYGSEAQLIKGNVNMINDNVQIRGNFEATKK